MSAGKDPGQTYEWLGVPMFINTVPTHELIDLIEQAGLRVTSTDIESQLEGGRPIDYAWIAATHPIHLAGAQGLTRGTK
jgi:hypothetical protein